MNFKIMLSFVLATSLLSGCIDTRVSETSGTYYYEKDNENYLILNANYTFILNQFVHAGPKTLDLSREGKYTIESDTLIYLKPATGGTIRLKFINGKIIDSDMEKWIQKSKS